jgi:hypothetical protein
MAAQDYTAVVQQLYVSYFGRPADYYGLQNFSAQLNTIGAPKTFAEVQAAVQADKAGTSALSKLVNGFNNSPESIALYGSDNSQIGISKFVAAIYQNVLGREADITGFNFWVNAITSGTLTKANAAAAITQAALTNTSDQGKLDALTVQHKLDVATAFTTAIDTPTEINAYSGDAAAAAARSLLAGVNSATNVTAYQANIVETINNLGNIVNGQSFSLTTAVDTLVGTSGNDVFNALSVGADGSPDSTVSSFDSIDGGAGKDTLNIYTDTDINDLADTSNITIKNVEVINVYNADTGVAALADASKYAGVTALWQVGAAADVANLQSTTTAGFRGLAAGVHGVKAVDAATSASIAVDSVVEGSTFNVGSTTTAGKLAAVTLSGTVTDGADAGTSVGATTLNVTVGKDVQTLTVNTAVRTVLNVTDSATKAVTTINGAASTGRIDFVGDADVTSITTGTGADHVTLASDLDATVKAATLSTGAGDDVIVVTVTGAAAADGSLVDTATVDAGAGDDDITVTLDNGVKFNVTGGAGDDLITLDAPATTAVKIGDVIDGGDGVDTIGLAGKVSYVSDDYLVYTKVLKNFEAIEFNTAAGTTTAFDASQVAGFKTFTFDLGGSITKVAADQAVSTGGNLVVQAAGYTAASSTGNASSTVYSTDTLTGALKVEATGTADVTAKGSSIALTVTAASDTADGDVVATLKGDVKTASITLANGVNSDDTASVASVHVTTAATAAGTGAYTALGGLTSLTLAGDGSATVVNAVGTKLVTVDASALASVDENGDAVAGLDYTSANASAETIKLGAGLDIVKLNASAYGGVGSAHTFDTVSGLTLVIDATTKTLDATASDVLVINGATALTVAKFTTSETDVDLALKAAAAANNADAAHNTLVFALGGDTYVMMDNGTDAGLIDAGDTVVKLTGTVNLDALVLAVAHGAAA